MKICIISYMFPGAHDSSSFAFVKQLVDAFAELGHHCFVLTPFNITRYRRLSRSREEYRKGRGKVTIYRPGYISFSNLHFGKFQVSAWFHKKAMAKAFRMLEERPDIVYGHFWSSGLDGYDYARRNQIPLFVATGESEIKRMFRLSSEVSGFTNSVSGVICVSSKNRDESIALGLTTPNKCIVLPNAINPVLFRRIDKQQCREKLGFPKEVFIVVFVGWFNERKGSERLAEAIKRIKGRAVYSIFIGRGEKEPTCDNILFKGILPHDQVPFYLNAADVFVLPTLHEGCCNAVVEAMACGLPIISSNRPFNWDVLDASNSILIDPNNIDEISSAIGCLRDDPIKCRSLSNGAINKSRELSINRRAESILSFINEKTTSK